jgi:hypothetical protein
MTAEPPSGRENPQAIRLSASVLTCVIDRPSTTGSMVRAISATRARAARHPR